MVSHMSEREFITSMKPKASHMKEDMQTSRDVDSGKRKAIPDEGVTEVIERGVKLSRPYYFVNAEEYAQVFHKDAPTLKKDLKNTISMPSEDDNGDELLYYFKTAGLSEFEREKLSHLRQGHMYTKKTLVHAIHHQKSKLHRFARQSGKVINHHLKQSGVALKHQSVRSIQQERENIYDPDTDPPDFTQPPVPDTLPEGSQVSSGLS